ncbi:MAG: glycoside hydrolase family 2 TIM barrel-domain containing protein [Candidatus Omnitrophica bacterium]|nr:glycoside hydrolase family 2 TIM barrel-domain containing protein [Candidatus Omnitrophota bacterium]
MKSNSNNKNNAVIKTTGRKIFLLAACSLLLLALLSKGDCSKRPKVYIRQLKNGHYQLMVNNSPYIIKGVCYNPIPIGQNHEYDWWSDPNKPWEVDGKLMQEMGVNAVRIYQSPNNSEHVKRVIRELYEKYGIRTILGSWLGFWEYPCPFYGDKKFQKKVKEEVLEMVRSYKDEPGVLMWVLGNENNYSCFGHVNPWSSPEIDKEPNPQKQKEMRAKVYYSFVNDITREIKKIDKEHPVALGNGELLGLEFAKEYAPDIDVVACIIYRGRTFGNLFKSLKMTFDKPIFISELGADAYDAYLKKEDQNMQAFFLESQWRQIYENLAGNEKGAGNCLGGAIFEWNDEWWKHDEHNPDSWSVHDTESNWSNSSYYFDIKAEGNKNMNEEWFGIVALSTEMENGLNKRIPRKAYYVIREFWKNPDLNVKRDKK